MRPELVTECVDQRMQTASAGARLVHTQDGMGAVVRAGGHPAAPATAAVGTGATAPPGMGWGSFTVGLDRDLTAPTASWSYALALPACH